MTLTTILSQEGIWKLNIMCFLTCKVLSKFVFFFINMLIWVSSNPFCVFVAGIVVKDLFVGFLLAQRPSNMLLYCREGSAEAIVCIATLRSMEVATCYCIAGRDLLKQLYVLPHWDLWKSQINLAVSPSHRILTPGQPVLVLTLKSQTPDWAASRVPIIKSPV